MKIIDFWILAGFWGITMDSENHGSWSHRSNLDHGPQKIVFCVEASAANVAFVASATIATSTITLIVTTEIFWREG